MKANLCDGGAREFGAPAVGHDDAAPTPGHLLYPGLTSGYLGQLAPGPHMPWFTFGLAAIVALTLTVLTKGQLGYRPERAPNRANDAW